MTFSVTNDKFPLPTDRTASDPAILLSKEQLRQLHFNANVVVETGLPVAEWTKQVATQLGWKQATFLGAQCLLSIAEPSSAPAVEEVQDDTAATHVKDETKTGKRNATGSGEKFSADMMQRNYLPD